MAKQLDLLKSIIHPRQINIIHDVFTPSEADVKDALRVIRAQKKQKRRDWG